MQKIQNHLEPLLLCSKKKIWKEEGVSSHFLPLFNIPIFLLFFLTSISFCFGQDLSYVIYNQSHGISHNHIYSLLQDSKGFIWFATETGVSRFDGVSFTNYFANDGLTDNEILEIHEGDDGKIWFMSYSPGICYYKNGKIYNSKNDSVLSQIKFEVFVNRMCNAAQGNLYMLTEKGQLFLLSEKELKLVNTGLLDATITFVWKDANDSVWLLAPDYYFNIASGVKFNSKYSVSQKKSVAIVLKNGALIKESEKGVVLFDGYIEKLIIPFDSVKSSINFIYADRNENLWLMLSRGVMYFEKSESGWEKRELFLQDYVINRIVQDREGGMWFGTADMGVLYSSSQQVFSYFRKTDHSEEEAYCITRDKTGNMWFGLGGNKIGIIGNGVQKVISLNPYETESPIRIMDILSRDDGSIWIGGDDGVYRIEDVKSETILQVYTSTCKKIIDNGSYVIGGFSGDVVELEGNYSRLLLNKENVFNNRCREIFDQRTHAVAIINDSMILVGTNSGLKLIYGKEIVLFPEKNPVVNRITDIKVANDGSIWFSTFGWGVGVIRGENVTEIRQKNGLLSDICKSIYIDKNNYIWVATNMGINRVKLDDNNKLNISSYTTRDGLPSNDINAVYVWLDTVWIASSDGISNFNYTVPIRHKTAPLVYLKRIAINQHDTILTNNSIFPSDSNNITFYFTGISYQSFGQISYIYRLLGIESEWNTTTSHLVHYSMLPAGDYLFEVFAVSADGLKSEFPETFYFTIKPHFLFSKPVIIAEFIILFLILVSIVYFVSSITKAKEKRKTKLAVQFAESEMKALRAQMNPHFIFNSINTLQGYIIDSDKKAAYEYLEKFGSLMRNILEQSAEKWISLQDEIDTLNIYITLESNRFDNKFDYSISVDENINTNKVLVPPMLLQPYIENAIKHGIIPKNDKGKIKVSFKSDGKILVCSIEDNGIGRKKSYEIKSGHERKSFGMDITKQRVDLLSKIFSDERYEVLIHDLYDEQGISKGTLVEIYIPVNLISLHNHA